MTQVVEKPAMANGVEVADGIIHLGGNLYRVRHDLIKYTDAALADGKKLVFRNPRRMNASGTSMGKGLDNESMSKLRESIRLEGLKNPIQLRSGQNLGEQAMPIIEGERRKRCIDRLLKENEQCYDMTTGTMRPAEEVYEYVECRIFINIDEKAAFKAAFRGNDTAEPIGEACTVATVKYCRGCGLGDEDIIDITGFSTTTLRNYDKLCALDDKTFSAIANDEINHEAAVELAGITDLDERLARLAHAKELAQQRVLAIRQKAQKTKEQAEEDEEIAEAQVAEALITDNPALKDKAEKKLGRAKKKIDKADKAVEKTEKTKKVGIKDVRSASGEAKPITSAKADKFYWTVAAKIVKALKKNPKDKDFAGIDIHDAELVVLIGKSMEKGVTDLAKILRKHNS